jgi:hypothetical protein
MQKAAVAAAICVFAWMALLPVQDGAAQERPSPSPEATPLSSTAESSAHAKAASTSVRRDRRPVSAPSDGSDGSVPLVTLTLLGLVTAGMMVTFVGLGRRRRESAREAAPAPLPPSPAKAVQRAQPLWHGRSDRLSSATTAATARRPAATVAVTEQKGGGDPRSSGDDRTARDGAAPAPAPAADAARSATPVAAAAAGAPPNTHLAWTAEIEWRQINGTARFRVIARGPDTVTLAQSPPLEWPPSGPAAVQATTDAAEELAATLAAAGWKALPPGRAWYAKRFAWEPVAATPADAAPSNGVGGAKAPAARGEARARGRDRSGLSRWKQVAWLGVLAAVGIVHRAAARKRGRGRLGVGASRGHRPVGPVARARGGAPARPDHQEDPARAPLNRAAVVTATRSRC